MVLPHFGAISVIKIAAPSENGVANRMARPQVRMEPKIYTAAPILPFPGESKESVGFQFSLKRKSITPCLNCVKEAVPRTSRNRRIAMVMAMMSNPMKVTNPRPKYSLLNFSSPGVRSLFSRVFTNDEDAASCCFVAICTSNLVLKNVPVLQDVSLQKCSD